MEQSKDVIEAGAEKPARGAARCPPPADEMRLVPRGVGRNRSLTGLAGVTSGSARWCGVS